MVNSGNFKLSNGSNSTGSGSFELTGGTLTLTDGFATASNLLLNGGNINGAGTLTVNGGMQWRTGDINSNIALAVGSVSSKTTSASPRIQNGNLTNNGTFDWVEGDFSGFGGTFTNGGTLTISGSNVYTNQNGSNQLINTGSIIKANSAGSTFIQPPTTNSGSIKGRGTLNFQNTITNTGIIAPGTSPGLLTLNGSQPLSATSTLQIEIQDGSGAGTGHDQLARDGSLTLAGTLTVVETANAPAGIYTIINLTSGNISGSFSTVNIPPCYTLQVNATSVTVTKLFSPTPIISAIRPTTFCQGDSVILTSSLSSTYMWSNGDTTQSITVKSSGKFSLTSFNAVGCISLPADTVTIKVNPLPAKPTITANGPTTFCLGDSVTLTSSITTNIRWSLGGITRSTIKVKTGNNNFAVTTTDANGCQNTSDSTRVIVNSLPAVPTISANKSLPVTFCNGDSVTLTVNTTGGLLWNNGDTSTSIKVKANGSFTVTKTNANGCKSASLTTVVTVNDLPAKPTISNIRPTTFCLGDSVVLTSSEASSFLWSNGASTQSITVKVSGKFSLTVFNAAGCVSSAADSVSVSVNALPAKPTISANRPTTFCLGDSVILTSSATNNIRWSTGATSVSIKVKTGTNNFAVTTTDANGCKNTSDSTRVVVNSLPPVPTIFANRPITFCDGDSVILTSSTNTGIVWSNGVTSASINVKTSGSFSVTKTNANGCKSTSLPTIVTVNALPATPIISANRPTTFCLGDSTVLTANTNVGLLWNNGATSQSIIVKTGGTFSVTTTNANGCKSNPANTLVTVTPVPATPTITRSQGSTALCQGDSITLTSSANNGNVWSNGATTKNIVVKTAGPFSVKVTNNFGCTSANSSVITISVNVLPPVPTISSSGAIAFCQGDSVTLTSSSSINNVWSTEESTRSIVVKTSGSFTVTRSNANGCKSTSLPVLVTVNALPPTPVVAANRPTTFCNGDSVILTSSAASGNIWNNNEISQSITVKGSGDFSVTATDANGCKATSLPTTIVANSIPPTPSISITGNTTFCQGDSVILTSGATSGNVWSNGETTQSIKVIALGTFSVSVTLLGCSSAPSAPITITVNALPPTPTISASKPLTFCNGDSVILTSSAAAGNVWSNGETSRSITVKNSGSFTVTKINSTGCSATSAPTVVTVNPIPATPTITVVGNTTFCQGDSVMLISSDATGNEWSTGQVTQSIKVTSSGNFTVTTTLLECKSASSNTVNVTVNPIPATPTISASGSTTFCNGDSVTLTSSAVSGNVWSTGETTQSIKVKTTATITVTTTNQFGCTSDPSAPFLVTVNPIPAIPTIAASGNTTFCNGDSVTLTSSATFGNIWSNGETTQSIKVKTTGTFSVIATALGCFSASSIPASIVVNPIPATPTVTASGPTTFCSGGSVTLTSSATSGNVWSTGAITNTLRVTTNGSFTVRATALGCSSLASIPVVITVNSLPAKPTISANGPTTFCQGDSVFLSCNVSSGIKWSTGETTQIIKVKTGAQYTVTRTGTNGCTNTSLVTLVTVNPLPATPTISPSGIQSICQGESLILTSSPSSNYVWSTGAISQSITISNAGNFSVRVTDAKGCSSLESSVTTVSVKPLPTVNATTGTANVCIGSTRQLSNTTPSGVWSSLSPGIATVSSSGLVTGKSAGTAIINYTVTGTNGCSKIVSFSMVVNALPSITNIIGDTSVCKGSTTRLLNFTTGGTWSSSKSSIASISSTGLVTGVSAGTVTISYTVGPNSNGCSSVVTMNFTVHGLPSVGTIGGITTVCVGNTTQLNISTPLGSWFSSNGNATVNISSGLVTGVQVGTSTITFRTLINSFGCSNTTSKVVTILAPCFAIAKASLIEPIATEPMKVSIYPNPTGNVFNVQVKAPKQESINIRVLDVNGRTAFAAKGMPGQVLHFGEQLKAGTYLVEVRQGEEVKTVKAVKIRQ